MKYTHKLITEAQKLREVGLSYPKIGDKLGISKTTAHRWCNMLVGPKPPGKPKTHKLTLIPELREKMREANASIDKLAEAAGVSPTPVRYALKGKPIHVKNAEYILEALYTRTFIRSPIGRQL